jgi:hypothetical protein
MNVPHTIPSGSSTAVSAYRKRQMRWCRLSSGCISTSIVFAIAACSCLSMYHGSRMMITTSADDPSHHDRDKMTNQVRSFFHSRNQSSATSATAPEKIPPTEFSSANSTSAAQSSSAPGSGITPSGNITHTHLHEGGAEEIRIVLSREEVRWIHRRQALFDGGWFRRTALGPDAAFSNPSELRKKGLVPLKCYPDANDTAASNLAIDGAGPWLDFLIVGFPKTGRSSGHAAPNWLGAHRNPIVGVGVRDIRSCCSVMVPFDPNENLLTMCEPIDIFLAHSYCLIHKRMGSPLKQL